MDCSCLESPNLVKASSLTDNDSGNGNPSSSLELPMAIPSRNSTMAPPLQRQEDGKTGKVVNGNDSFVFIDLTGDSDDELCSIQDQDNNDKSHAKDRKKIAAVANGLGQENKETKEGDAKGALVQQSSVTSNAAVLTNTTTTNDLDTLVQGSVRSHADDQDDVCMTHVNLTAATAKYTRYKAGFSKEGCTIASPLSDKAFAVHDHTSAFLADNDNCMEQSDSQKQQPSTSARVDTPMETLLNNEKKSAIQANITTDTTSKTMEDKVNELDNSTTMDLSSVVASKKSPECAFAVPLSREPDNLANEAMSDMKKERFPLAICPSGKPGAETLLICGGSPHKKHGIQSANSGTSSSHGPTGDLDGKKHLSTTIFHNRKEQHSSLTGNLQKSALFDENCEDKDLQILHTQTRSTKIDRHNNSLNVSPPESLLDTGILIGDTHCNEEEQSKAAEGSVSFSSYFTRSQSVSIESVETRFDGLTARKSVAVKRKHGTGECPVGSKGVSTGSVMGPKKASRLLKGARRVARKRQANAVESPVAARTCESRFGQEVPSIGARSKSGLLKTGNQVTDSIKRPAKMPRTASKIAETNGNDFKDPEENERVLAKRTDGEVSRPFLALVKSSTWQGPHISSSISRGISGAK